MHIAEKQELGAFIYDIHREVGRNRAKICSKFVDKHNRIWGVRWERGNRTVMGTSYIENPLWIEAKPRSSLVISAINKVNKLQSIHQTEFRKNEKVPMSPTMRRHVLLLRKCTHAFVPWQKKGLKVGGGAAVA